MADGKRKGFIIPKPTAYSLFRSGGETRNTRQKIDEQKGLECRACRCKQFRVIYTRSASGGRIVRRRQCRHCGKRLTTSERAIGG